MTQFDMSLRRALMDANLAQYESALLRAESVEPEFSPQYLRERTRLLSDPWSWLRQRSRLQGKKRLDWRLIAVVAALLLLSACAYAVVTGQFAQWFPRLGMDPAAPEVSEEVLSRTGTVIEQSQTVGDETATLNAAVWDGSYLCLSLTVESPHFPEELTKDSRIYTEECSIAMDEERWKEYVRKDEESHGEGLLSKDLLEKSIQARLDMGQADYWNHISMLNFNLISREETTLTFEVTMELGTYLEQPELTLHVENIAIYEDSDEPLVWMDGVQTGPEPEVPVLSGPFDFTFILEEPILPIRYAGDIPITVGEIPFRLTGFELSVFDIEAEFDVLGLVDIRRSDEEPDPDKLDDVDVTNALSTVLRGVWTVDGGYVDFEGGSAGLAMTSGPDGEDAKGSVNRNYPYVTDPATVTAVNLDGTRVELRELELLAD